MAKKTLSIRVPPDTYDEFEEYRDARSDGGEQLSKADAGRRLLESGLEDHQHAETDGGEVVERVDELHDRQRRAETREQRHDALIGVALLVGVLVVSGVADGPLALLSAGAVGVALVSSSLWGYVGDSDE